MWTSVWKIHTVVKFKRCVSTITDRMTVGRFRSVHLDIDSVSKTVSAKVNANSFNPTMN